MLATGYNLLPLVLVVRFLLDVHMLSVMKDVSFALR